MSDDDSIRKLAHHIMEDIVGHRCYRESGGKRLEGHSGMCDDIHDAIATVPHGPARGGTAGRLEPAQQVLAELDKEIAARTASLNESVAKHYLRRDHGEGEAQDREIEALTGVRDRLAALATPGASGTPR